MDNWQIENKVKVLLIDPDPELHTVPRPSLAFFLSSGLMQFQFGSPRQSKSTSRRNVGAALITWVYDPEAP
jgi:hypothetical protein